MKVMVTGGAGFVGTNLIKRLLKDGHEVVSIDNYSTGTEENHQEGCVYHDVDIRDAVDFDFFMENPDIIYHLAALPRGLGQLGLGSRTPRRRNQSRNQLYPLSDPRVY